VKQGVVRFTIKPARKLEEVDDAFNALHLLHSEPAMMFFSNAL
jgi:hypothetical protein